MAGSRSKRPVIKRRESQRLESQRLESQQLESRQRETPPLSEENGFYGRSPASPRKPFTLSCPVLLLLTVVILLLFWSGWYRNLFYITARYDFPAELGGEEPFWADLAQPGGLRISAGSWLAALGTLPMAVPVLLTLVSTGAVFFFGRLLRIGRTFSADSARWCYLYALAPILLLTILVPVQGYYFFGCYRAGFFLSLLVGVSAAAGTAWGVERTVNDRKRLVYGIIALIFGYPLFGSFALLAGLMMIRAEGERYLTEKSCRPVRAMLALLGGIAAVPLIWYPVFSSRISLTAIYSEGLFHQTAVKRDAVTANLTWGLSAAVLFLLIVPVLWTVVKVVRARFFPKVSARKPVKNGSEIKGEKNENSRLALLILILCAAGLTAYGARDTHFRSTLSFVRLLDEARWEEILERESAVEEPTAPMIELRRLALIQTGRAADQFFARPSAGSVTEPLKKVTSYRIFGPELLFYSGNVSFAEHLAMNDFVDLRGRAPFYLKIFFLCAMAKREYPLARRYFDHWKQTVRWWSAPAQKREVRLWEEFLIRTEQDGMEPPAGTDNGTKEAVSLLEAVRTQQPAEEMTQYHHLARSIASQKWQKPFAELPVRWMEVRLLRLLTACDLPQFTELFPVYYDQLKKEGRPIPAMLEQGWIYAEFYQTNHLPPVQFPCDPAAVQQFAYFLQIWNQVPARQPDGSYPPSAAPVLTQLKELSAGTWWYYAHEEMEALAMGGRGY